MKIGLCMIVKDESHIIHEVLECTLPLIDTYMILDTGSTDNTIQIINDFYSKTEIGGQVIQSEWKGFGPSRSEALKLCDGKMDYILMIDADDLICFPKVDNIKENLKKAFEEQNPNAINIQIKRGELSYSRTQIFKANDDWRYVGVLHEYPTNDKKDNKMANLPSEIYMVGRTMGNRSKQEDKYLKDAEVLLKELETEPNNERYVFYLAQSYRDGGKPEEAIKWYKKRVEMGGWIEECSISAMNISKMLGDKEWAWKAHEINTTRSEALVWYAAGCRAKSAWSQELYALIMYAATIPKPSGNLLFVENDIYDWKVWDELAIIAFYTGHKDVAKQANLKLLTEKKLPESQISRIEANLKFCL